jgi:phosphoribosyl 1,2-cyclic phosphodiesterase
MNLKILGSSSAGNCYIFENETEALILEAGISAKRVKIALGFNLSKVVGCLISHEHGDHAKYAHDFGLMGITAYASKGTIEAIGSTHRTHVLKPKVKHKIGGFTVLPFPVEHDVREPFGYLVYHTEMGYVLFATDTYFLQYTFAGLNNILIEANYALDILNEKVSRGSVHIAQRQRVLTSHMDIETCKEVLKANDLSAVNNIVLIHLSDSNSDAARFKREVKELTGKRVHIAEPDLVIPFNKTPF